LRANDFIFGVSRLLSFGQKMSMHKKEGTALRTFTIAKFELCRF